MAETVRKPVPEEAGLGMVTRPLYSGLARSAKEAGTGSLRLESSTVLAQNAVIQASMPNQAGSAAESL